MCGYVRRHISNRDLERLVKTLQMPVKFDRPEQDEPMLEHFYAAFGGVASKQIKGMVIQENGQLKAVNATWWFDCTELDGTLVVNNSRTTFNARNLTSPYWKGAIRHHRGIAIATAIGEGKNINGKNRHYFVEGQTPLLLGTVYRPFPNGLYSTAVITRDSHPRFEPYHDKAFPLFLPHDPQFLKLWLDNDIPETHPAIAHLLVNPRIFNDLKITPVKTFKDAVATGETELLEADQAA